MKAKAQFETQNASRYLATLCKHFGRKVDVDYGSDAGWVQFPFGRCEMTIVSGTLAFLASAEDAAGLDQVTLVISRHLERFAFREAPDLAWKAAAPSPH